MSTSIPVGAAGLNAQWLSHILDETIHTVDVARIGENEGFTGAGLYRLQIPGRASLVAKLSPKDPLLRAQYANANAREVMFYTAFAQGLPVPDCLYGACDHAAGTTVVLLQDLSAARAVPFFDGLWPRDVAAVLHALAKIHATWWNAPALEDLSSTEVLSDFDFAAPWARYPDALRKILPDMALPERLRALGDYAAIHHAEIYASLHQCGPLTVQHRDPQIDNILFRRNGDALLLDWQIFGKGRGVWDVAYFLISSVPSLRRRRNERAWVEAYHAALVAHGITDYPLEICWRDYVRSVIGKFFMSVFATVNLNNATAHKRAWRRVDLTRLLAFIEDHALTPALWDFSND